jgi:hypothetical protein
MILSNSAMLADFFSRGRSIPASANPLRRNPPANYSARYRRGAPGVPPQVAKKPQGLGHELVSPTSATVELAGLMGQGQPTAQVAADNGPRRRLLGYPPLAAVLRSGANPSSVSTVQAL